MTREEIIKAIYRGYNCQGNCAYIDIPCKECIEKQFAEYEKQIITKAVDCFKEMVLTTIEQEYMFSEHDEKWKEKWDKTMNSLIAEINGLSVEKIMNYKYRP